MVEILKFTKNIKATSDFIYNNFAENSGNTTHSVMSTQEEIAYTPGGSKFTNSGFGIFMGLSYTFN